MMENSPVDRFGDKIGGAGLVGAVNRIYVVQTRHHQYRDVPALFRLFLISLQTAKPSISGMTTSSSTMPGLKRSKADNASIPSAACSTMKPDSSSRVLAISRAPRSSSTTRATGARPGWTNHPSNSPPLDLAPQRLFTFRTPCRILEIRPMSHPWTSSTSAISSTCLQISARAIAPRPALVDLSAWAALATPPASPVSKALTQSFQQNRGIVQVYLYDRRKHPGAVWPQVTLCYRDSAAIQVILGGLFRMVCNSTGALPWLPARIDRRRPDIHFSSIAEKVLHPKRFTQIIIHSRLDAQAAVFIGHIRCQCHDCHPGLPCASLVLLISRVASNRP